MTIAFIHIGKTGGTTIHTLLKTKISKYKDYHQNNNYKPNEQYIIWLRNPISRFVSAFNHVYYAITTDAQSIESFDLEHCLLPLRMKNSIDRKYVFSPTYDSLVKKFTSANHLAENLLTDEAIELMNSDMEHFKKGIGWYLNTKFIEKNNNNILFVGRQENMKEDIQVLSKKLDIPLDDTLKLRENIYIDKSMKYLSPTAIKNIIEWYKDTDYAALEQLYKYGWINNETYSSYYLYTNE